MKRIAWILMFALLPFLTVSCGEVIPDDDNGDNPYKPLSLSTKQAGYVAAGNDFAFRFIGQVADQAAKNKEDAWFVSPLSLQLALGMLLNGAQGETADEICGLLGYGKGETADINEFCKLLLKQLPALDKKTKLTLANAIFYNQKLTLKTPFKNTVTDYYSAELKALDFTKGKAAAGTINDWCSRQTNGLIPSVIDNVEAQALAYLINALYFKSEWREKFDKNRTEAETFTQEDGKTDKVKMMKLDGKQFNYRESDAYQAIWLPYGNGAYSMAVLLPKKGHTVQEISGLLAKEGIRTGSPVETDLWLPRFEMKYHILLNGILQDLGMKRSFNPQTADFLAMSEKASYVDFVQQDAVIKVDEEGTEAAAVTVIGMMTTAIGPSGKVVFHANRPFLYLITESSTGAVLFAGKYAGK